MGALIRVGHEPTNTRTPEKEIFIYGWREQDPGKSRSKPDFRADLTPEEALQLAYYLVRSVEVMTNGEGEDWWEIRQENEKVET